MFSAPHSHPPQTFETRVQEHCKHLCSNSVFFKVVVKTCVLKPGLNLGFRTWILKRSFKKLFGPRVV